jgi:CheY-like chemotaxis protein
MESSPSRRDDSRPAIPWIGPRIGNKRKVMARILVVDDDALIRNCLRMALQGAGYEVVEAGCRDHALREFRRQRADLVLCDLFMPGGDGLDTIRELRSEFPDVRIIAMSGGALGGKLNLLPAAEFLGAVTVLAKPFKLATALAAVERGLDQSTADLSDPANPSSFG